LRSATQQKQGYNWACRPGDRGPAQAGPRKVRTPKGRTLGKSQAAKADGKWHRKETASGGFQTPSGARRSRLRRRGPPRSRVRCSSRRATGGLERWSPPTESGLQACYRETLRLQGFSISGIDARHELGRRNRIRLGGMDVQIEAGHGSVGVSAGRDDIRRTQRLVEEPGARATSPWFGRTRSSLWLCGVRSPGTPCGGSAAYEDGLVVPRP
jgi:hypothetical protein